MKATALVLALSAVLALGSQAQASESVHAAPHPADAAATPSARQAATQAALRDLWVEHVFWIRDYVNARAEGDAARQRVAADQVVANATAISGAVAGFYGQPAGDHLLGLLAGHWAAVKDYADASFGQVDAAAQHAAAAALTANAKDIAAFLAQANPYLPEATLVGLLGAHGAHHIAQIQQLSKRDFAAEARTWAAMRQHMFTIADALTAALAKQFPAKF